MDNTQGMVFDDAPNGAQTQGANQASDMVFDSAPPQVQPPAETKTQPPLPSAGERFTQGFASSAAEGLAGVAKLASRIPGVSALANKIGDVAGLPKLTDGANAYDNVQNAMKQQHDAATKTTAGAVGSGVEGISEFILGDEALKGMSLAEKAGVLSKLAKLAETHPTIAKIIKSGIGNARMGTVAAGQGVVHGDTVGQAATQGAVAGGLGAAGDVALSGLGSAYQAFKKAGFAGAALDAATKLAGEHVRAPEELADSLKGKLNNAEGVMHTSFDNAMESIKGKLGTDPIPVQGTPLHDAATELKGEVDKLPEEWQAGLKGLTPQAGNLRNLVEGILGGDVKETTGEQLLQLRQTLSKSLTSADPTIKQGIGKLLGGIDDTLDQMASKSGDEVSNEYSQARAAYRQSLKDLNEPFVDQIRQGKISNVLESVTKGQAAPYKLNVLKRLVGDDTVAGFGLNKFADVIKGATDDEGNVSIKKAVAAWRGMAPEARKAMFEATPEVGERLDQMMAGLRKLGAMTKVVRIGTGVVSAGLAGAGIAGGLHSTTSVLETVAGISTLLGARFGTEGLAEGIVTNPTLLRGLGKLFGYEGENLAGRVMQAGHESAATLAKMGPEGPQVAGMLDKIKGMDLGGEEGAAGAAVKRRNVGEPAASPIAPRGVSKPDVSYEANSEGKLGNMDHRVTTTDEKGNRIGELVAQNTKPDTVAVRSNQIYNPENRGQGLGRQHIEKLADELQKDGSKKFLQSDISTTEDGKRPWKSMEEKYPEAVTRKDYKDKQQWTLDLSKWRNAAQSAGKTALNQADDVAVALAKSKQKALDTEGAPVLPTEQTGGMRISQRKPSGVKATEDPIKEDLTVGMDAIKKADAAKPGYAAKLAKIVSEYPGMPITPEEAALEPEKALEKFVNHISGNLQWLHDQIPEHVRNISKLWYDSAHELTKRWADKYGIAHEQMAGVVAALSPQNEWNNNVELGKRITDIYHTKGDFKWSPEMETHAARIGAKSDILSKIFGEIRGKSLNELSDPADKAAWIRTYDEAHNPRTMSNYAPDGSVRGIARTPVGNQPASTKWQSNDNVAKAISILQDGSKENIHEMVGDSHKVRNFYNNIIDPWHPSGDVTIDTHAVGAGHLRPMGGSATEVTDNFGGSSDANHGLSGTYSLYAEAYRRAAQQLGILPRELQAITWEGIRSLFESKAKAPELKSKIAQIWKDHKDGNITIDRARKQILKDAGGFKNPKWLSDLGQDGKDGSAAGQGDVPDSGQVGAKSNANGRGRG